MAKSILQKDASYCFLCGMNANLEPLDKHHVFNGYSLRKKSENDGLTVYLHHCKCHIFGENAVHRNADVEKRLKAFAQKKAMEYYGWDIEMFRKRYYKNYIGE